MAAAKDLHVFCVDISPSMAQPGRHGDSHLETSLKVMNQIVQQKMFTKSHDEFAVVLCGSEDTRNELSESEGGYENISVAMEMAVPHLDLLHFIDRGISPSTASADFIDALVVSMDVLAKAKEGRKKVGALKVFLFTDAASGYSDDGLGQICRGLKEMGIQLLVIGPDVENGPAGGDDGHHGNDRGHPASGVRGKKTQHQVDGERLLQRVVGEVEGELFSFSEALKVVSVIHTRAKKQTTRFNGNLEIGPKLKIPCKLFTKGMVEKPATWKKLSAVSQSSAHPISMAVRMERSHHKQDEDETEVEMEDVAKGYRYGKSLIPISSADEEAMKLETERCLQVLGFTHNRHVGAQLSLGSSVMVVIATPGDEQAGCALSAMIHALYEKQQCAVARYVWRAKAQAKLVVLRPCIKKDYECLLLTQLPFSEDLRPYYFGSLPASDKTTPTADQLEAVDNLITAMDLMEAHENEEGGRSEAFRPRLMFNPLLQRVFQAVRHRALHPDQLLPELDPLIARHLRQSEDVVSMAAAPLQRLKDVFPLKEVVQKGKGKGKKTAAQVWKESDADVDGEPASKQRRLGGGVDDTDFSMASLARGVVKEVGTLDPVKDYITLLGRGEDIAVVSRQLQNVILKLVRESFSDMYYPKALDCLAALRQQAIKHSCPQEFNDFLRSLKEDVIGTRYSPFWGLVIARPLTLITAAECSTSSVEEGEAKELLSGASHVTPQGAESVLEQQEDADDLLEMM